MSEQARRLLLDWLSRRLGDETRRWLQEQRDALVVDRSDSALYLAFGLLARRLPKGPLELSAGDVAAARDVLPGWSPGSWSVVDAGRVLLLSELPARTPDFGPRFRSLCQTADVAEAVSLYRGLPLYPGPAELEPHVGEGLRTNIRSVFEAIAHDNPYPREIFDVHRWNHMVLKALFIGSRLGPIQGLDERANRELARIMRDFAHERWAAARSVPFEIWRCIGPYADADALNDLDRVLSEGKPLEQRAAALALSSSPEAAAAGLLRKAPALVAEITCGSLTWQSLG